MKKTKKSGRGAGGGVGVGGAIYSYLGCASPGKILENAFPFRMSLRFDTETEKCFFFSSF